MPSPLALTVVDAADRRVWRVGYAPRPWAWPGWKWATAGRFGGRWDDSEGNFRTVYAGSTLLACLLEVLAVFRPDPLVAAELDAIVDGPEDDGPDHPFRAGAVPRSWLEPRRAASAHLTGRFCAVTSTNSIAALRPRFVALALRLGCRDFDAAALRDSKLRELTQDVASHLHVTTDLDGVTFASRLGDEHSLWAIFERSRDKTQSATLSKRQTHCLTADHPDITEAFRLLGLAWATA